MRRSGAGAPWSTFKLSATAIVAHDPHRATEETVSMGGDQ
jgi:hypothetical protein